VPGRVDIVGIEAHACHNFSELLSPRIAAASATAAQRVLELIRA
jgi:hypothetical protein